MAIGLRLSIKDKSLLLGNSFESGTQHPPDLRVPNIPKYWLIDLDVKIQTLSFDKHPKLLSNFDSLIDLLFNSE